MEMGTRPSRHRWSEVVCWRLSLIRLIISVVMGMSFACILFVNIIFCMLVISVSSNESPLIHQTRVLLSIKRESSYSSNERQKEAGEKQDVDDTVLQYIIKINNEYVAIYFNIVTCFHFLMPTLLRIYYWGNPNNIFQYILL